MLQLVAKRDWGAWEPLPVQYAVTREEAVPRVSQVGQWLEGGDALSGLGEHRDARQQFAFQPFKESPASR